MENTGEIKTNFEDAIPVVSVCVQTFRHAAFIEQCLNSILDQETTFPFEIILGEDESDDGTREICIRFAEQYPGKIKLFLRSRKDVIYISGKPTGRYNFIQNIYTSQGKYIAMCEGDDYWSDRFKLQKQHDLLEKNPDYGICFHKVQEVNSFNPANNKIFPDISEDTVFSIRDYIKSNKTATCSIFFNKSLLLPLPDWFYKLPFGDLGLVLLIMSRSNEKGIVLNSIMGVYRVHDKGIHGSMKKDSRSIVNAYRQHLQFTAVIGNEFLTASRYRKDITRKMIDTLAIIRNHYRDDKNYKGVFMSSIRMYYYKVLNKLSAA